ncbi:MAG: 3-deoxy-7-phosphoheptulonate synthase [Sedimentisphaerales bacterium]|nr:3-deoxy-7-phosphoheptulonate synthase [Sedimentisphaerales bacterium]
MLIVMRNDATADQIEQVCNRIRQLGWMPNRIPGSMRVAIGITGNKSAIDPQLFEPYEGISECVPVSKPYKLVSREVKPEATTITVNGQDIGPNTFTVIAGPCSVESREQVLVTARAVKAAGAQLLRGGAFKPRTSPYSFQGLEEEGLKILAEARDETGLGIVTEVKDTDKLDMVAQYADVLQVGARNMQNFSLLQAVGRLNKPVLLKKGMSATVEELLQAAEYIVSNGNFNVILCERGIRTFETVTRNTQDLSAVAAVKRLSHLPVIVDPSHGTGHHWGVAPLARAAAAVGADGVMIEVHPDPRHALCDGQQALTCPEFKTLFDQLCPLAGLMGRRI